MIATLRAAEADNTPPTEPSGLAATTLSCSEIRLAWKASTDEGGSGLRGYRIFRSGNYVTEVAASSTVFVDSGLSPSATYSYTVVATDAAGNESLPAEAINATTLACNESEPPGIPTELRAVVVDCGAVTLNWKASVDVGGAGIRGYRIYRNGVYVTEIPAPATQYLETGLASGRTYSFRVSAKNSLNIESPLSLEALATTPPCDDITPPSAPTLGEAVVLSCSEVRLSWSASTDAGGSGIRGYRILRNGVYVTEVSAESRTFVDGGVSPSRAYSYVVTAKDKANNESVDSNAKVVTTPACETGATAPSGLVATPAACGQVNLIWVAPTEVSGVGLRGYRIYRNGVYVTEVSAEGTAFADVGVSPNRAYFYTVSAVDKSGAESGKSAVANVTAASCSAQFKGDFNQDLNTDVVLQHADGSVAFWLMSGTTIDRGFIPYTIPPEWRIVGVGDFNRDGSSDIVLVHSDRSVAFWLMRDTTIVEGIIPLQLPDGWNVVATGDFNRDGQTDLVLQDGGGNIAFWFMDGTAVASVEASVQVPAGWRVAGAGRFDTDEHLDLVLQHADGSVAFWLMQGTTITSGFIAYQIPIEWTIVATGHYNADRKSDIILQHTDGSVAFWLMEGTVIGDARVPYVIPVGWRIAGPR